MHNIFIVDIISIDCTFPINMVYPINMIYLYYKECTIVCRYFYFTLAFISAWYEISTFMLERK